MAKKGKYIYDWPRAMVCVDSAVFGLFGGKVKLLMIKRKGSTFTGMWALPGGFVEMDEELEDGAARELAEETGLSGVKLEQMGTFGRCGRDPRGRVISVVYIGFVEESSHEGGEVRVEAGDDAAEARWFDIDKLPAEMAFDHEEIVTMAIDNLRKKGCGI